jgi:chorismate lyase/3-hydroxybenzoate synthase
LPRYAAGAEPALGAIDLPLPQFAPPRLLETWPARGPVREWTEEGFTFATDGATLLGRIAVDGGAIETMTREVYASAIALVRKYGTPYFLRMWNHVGDINAFDDDRERYQLFCAGRHDAFAAAGYHLDTDLPAASAVGMRGRGLMTYFLASAEPGTQVENPRQIEAYRYPRQYGPKSPSFSRATVFGDVVFVSGTSSVVGHATVHAGDVIAQLEETLRNLDVVIARALPGGGLANIAVAKTYVRRASDYDAIARRLEGVFAENLFVEADICRADLLLEIEAIAR